MSKITAPYLDTVENHTQDPTHNLLLGTGKYVLGLWNSLGSKPNFEEIVNMVRVPQGVGRIPYKISSKVSGFTTDQ